MNRVVVMVLVVAVGTVGVCFVNQISLGYSFGECPWYASDVQEESVLGVRMCRPRPAEAAPAAAPAATTALPEEGGPGTPGAKMGDGSAAPPVSGAAAEARVRRELKAMREEERAACGARAGC